MKDAVGRIIEELLVFYKNNYNKPKLWISLGLCVFCLLMLFPYIDSNFFYFSRMEKRINVLERVMELDEAKINSNPAYKKEYESMLQEIEQQRDRTINSVMNKVNRTIKRVISSGREQGTPWIKFLTGGFWFILLTVCIPFMNTFNKRGDKILAFVLMLIISLVVGWFFMSIPIIWKPAVNYVGIPILQMVIFIYIMIKMDKKQK